MLLSFRPNSIALSSRVPQRDSHADIEEGMDHMDGVRDRQTGKDRPRIRDKQVDGGKVRGKQIHRDSTKRN